MPARGRFFHKVIVPVLVLGGLIFSGSLHIRQQADHGLTAALADNAASVAVHHAERIKSLENAAALLDRVIIRLRDQIAVLNADTSAQVQAIRNSLQADLEEAKKDHEALKSALQHTEEQVSQLVLALRRGEDVDQRLLDFVAERTAPAVPWAVQVRALIQTTVVYRAQSTGAIVHTESGRKWFTIGSGFIVAPGQLVSAGHVLEQEDQTMSGFGHYETPSGAIIPVLVEVTYQDIGRGLLFGDIPADLKDIKYTMEPDAGVATFDPSLYDGPYPVISEAAPPYGAVVWVAAYRPEIRLDGPLPVRGLFAGEKGGEDYSDTLIVTIPGQPGFSGSALLYRGEIVGIVVHGYGRGDYHWLGMTPIKAALEMLTEDR